MEAGSWIGVAALAISGLFAYLGKRDATLHDSKLKELETTNTIQAGQIARLTSDHQECKDEHTATKQSLDECKEKHDHMDSVVFELRRDIDEIKDKLPRN